MGREFSAVLHAKKTSLLFPKECFYIDTDTDIDINRNRQIMGTNWASFTTSWLLADLSTHICTLG